MPNNCGVVKQILHQIKPTFIGFLIYAWWSRSSRVFRFFTACAETRLAFFLLLLHRMAFKEPHKQHTGPEERTMSAEEPIYSEEKKNSA